MSPRRRRLRALPRAAGLVLLLGLAACEDPIIVVGDLPGIMRRVAGMPNRVGATVDSLANRTLLHEPRGLAVAADGTLYVADSENARIVEVTRAGRASILAAASGCSEDCLVEPHGLAIDRDGALWIADPGAHRVFRLDPETGVLEARAGSGVRGISADGTPALEAQLDAPTGIVIGTNGVPYFSERGGHRIRWIQAQGVLRTLAGTGEPGYSGDGGAADAARLNGPMGMTIFGSMIYFADEQNNRVRSVALVGGQIRTVAGNGVAGYSETDSIAVTAILNRPRALAVTPDARQLFIADAVNHRVRVVDLASGRIAPFAGTGEPWFTTEGLDAADTPLDAPEGLVIHEDGTLFIADTGHQIVWRTPLRF